MNIVSFLSEFRHLTDLLQPFKPNMVLGSFHH